jgi:hypothetical protein
MKKLSVIIAILAIMVAMIVPHQVSAAVGDSDYGRIDDEWYLDLNPVYGWGWLGVTPGIVNLPDVNTYGGEPDSDLEIVTGSDGYWSHVNPSGNWSGLWRAIDSLGNVEWYKDTQSDEARGSVAITDLNGDGNLEIVGGTTSGRTIEVLDRFGNFVWTFPSPPSAGNFYWSSAPAVGNLNPGVSGLEVVAVHRPTCNVVVLDGDNSDGVNDGITFTGLDGDTWWSGTEGTSWDVLWTYDMNGYDCHGSAAIGDVDNDGALEVVVGSQSGNVYVFDGATGALETTFTAGAVQASPALANLDGDPYLEIVIGDLGGTLYVFEWNGITASTQSSISLGSAIYSSVAIGNIDSDSGLEIVVGTYGGKVYALTSGLSQEWVYPSTGSVGTFYASPSLADRVSVGVYDIEWQMFRHDAMRTGYYGSAANPLDVYIGSMDGYLYLLNGDDGTMIDRFQASGPIHGSPTIGDIDGDGKLNIIFQSWGQWGGYTIYDRLWNVEEVAIPVPVDIKPQSCPNPLNVNDRGVLPAAILGTPTFDVTKIDVATVKLEGVSPLRSALEDVATPFVPFIGKTQATDCTTAGADGHMDLTLKFDNQAIVAALGTVTDGEVRVLKLTGNLKPDFGGTPIVGEDVVVILKKK